MKNVISNWSSTVEHLILLACAWAVFSMLCGLFGAFDVMEGSSGISLLQASMDGLKLSMIIMFIGGSFAAPILFIISYITKKRN